MAASQPEPLDSLGPQIGEDKDREDKRGEVRDREDKISEDRDREDKRSEDKRIGSLEDLKGKKE